METYIILFEHEYGVDIFRVRSDDPLFSNKIAEGGDYCEQFADQVGIMYEPARGETLTALSDATIREVSEPIVLSD